MFDWNKHWITGDKSQHLRKDNSEYLKPYSHFNVPDTKELARRSRVCHNGLDRKHQGPVGNQKKYGPIGL